MIPHEKEMVERKKDQPFALIGINSDGDRESLKEIMQEHGITWRNGYDGTPGSGPLANRWNVHGWPTIYILDAQGVIRHRDLRDQAMEEAVDALLAEMASKS